MAVDKRGKLNILTGQQRKELVELGEQIERSRAALSLLEELGLGVGDLRSKLDWTEKRRAILLDKG